MQFVVTRLEGIKKGKIPSNQMFRVVADLDIVGEVKTLLPVDNLPVHVLPMVCAERWPAHEALEHDGAEGPLLMLLGCSTACGILSHSIYVPSHSRMNSPAL